MLAYVSIVLASTFGRCSEILRPKPVSGGCADHDPGVRVLRLCFIYHSKDHFTLGVFVDLDSGAILVAQMMLARGRLFIK